MVQVHKGVYSKRGFIDVSTVREVLEYYCIS